MEEGADYQHLYQEAACGLISFKTTGEILYVNDRLLSWIFKTRSEIVGTHFETLLSSGSKLYYNLFILPLLQLGQEASEISILLRTAEGDLPVLLNAVLSSSTLAGAYVNATFFKIKDRKKFEQELLIETERVNQDIMIRNKALQDIAYSHAHLVRMPLSNIIGLISLLELEDHSGEASNIIERLQESAKLLDEVTKKIIDQSTF